MLEKSKNFPKRKSNTHALQFELEKLGINLFFDQKISWNHCNFTSVWILRLVFKDLLFEFFLNFSKAVFLSLHWVLDIVRNLLGDDSWIDFVEVDLLWACILKILT